MDFEVISEKAPVFEPHPFELRMTSGSDYQCLWDFGDGVIETTNEIQTPKGSTKTHTYTKESLDLAVNVSVGGACIIVLIGVNGLLISVSGLLIGVRGLLIGVNWR